MDKEKQFMKSALVAWVKTFDETVESVKDLADAVIFNRIMHAVDPNTYGLSRVSQTVGNEPSLRLQNLQLVINCIKHFYLFSQQQLVISALPEVTIIAHEPISDKSLEELEKLIILLLGCAIHSENNAQLITNMKNMQNEQQQDLIDYIKMITDTTEFVCSVDWNDLSEILKPDLEALCRTAYVHLQRVAKERDNLFDNLVETTQERNFYKDQKHHMDDPKPSPSPQVNPEFIELKKQVRVLHEDLDRKNEMVAEQNDELKQLKLVLQKLQHDKLEVMEDAKKARAYRDELETFKVQSAKAERLENEVLKYRQKAEDAEYLKKRVTELKQQNELMAETKTLLEQKVTSLTTRSDMVDDLQVEIASLKAQLDSLNQEKQMDMERIEDLVAQTARFELENKNNQEQIAQLMSELKTERERFSDTGLSSNSEGSLGFEMTEANFAQRAKLLRLEKEKREMEKSIEISRNAQAKVSELEKTNKKLYAQSHSDKKEIIKLREEVEVLKVKASRVDKLQTELSSQRDRLEEANRLQSRLKEMKSRNENVMEAKAMLEDQVEDLLSKIDLLDVLKGETAHLKAQVDALTSEQAEDQKRIQELMEQNAQLGLENQRYEQKASDLTMDLEQERSRIGNSPSSKLAVMSSPSEADMATKAKLQRLERELKELEKTKESLRHSQAKFAELEKTTKKLNKQSHLDKKEIIRLKEEIELYKTKTSRLERRRSIKLSQSDDHSEEVESARGKIAELKQQNTLIQESKALVEEELNSLQSKLANLGELQSENAVLKVRLSNLEQENQEESKRMQDLMQENAQLELEKERNISDIETLKSELDKLRAAASSKVSNIKYSPIGPLLTDSELATRAKLLRMERDYHELQRDHEMYKQRTGRAASEIENTNKKLNTQIHNDRKEIVRYREALKHEKEVTGKLTKQVEHLQKMVAQGKGEAGLSTPVKNEQKTIQELGNKIDEAYSQSLETKEKRIVQLEQRLEELRQENSGLRKRQALKDEFQTTSVPLSPSRDVESNRLREKNALLMAQVNDTGHLVEHQKQRIENLHDRIEMLEQLNQTLEEEKKTLLMQVNKLLEQNQSLLMRTLENKDNELEEERVFSDRLSELEREKTRLSEQLISQKKEAMLKEMEFLKKREKKKNPFKSGIKKIKGKLQTRTHKFDDDVGLIQPVSRQQTYMFQSSNTSLPDGSLSSNHSISSNSHHSDSYDELEGQSNSVPDMSTVGGFIPRSATLTKNSPVVLRQRKTQSLFVPPISAPQLSQMINSPSMRPDIISLEEFLAETNKTPNRRKLMELKRASVAATPPATPRSSMLFVNQQHNYPDQVELQDFLKTFHQSDDTMSIPEVVEEDQQYFSDEQTGLGSTTPEAKLHDVNNFTFNNNNNNNNNNSNNSNSPCSTSFFPCSYSQSSIPTFSEDQDPSNLSQSSEPPLPAKYYSTFKDQHCEVGGTLRLEKVSKCEDGKELKRLRYYSSLVDLTSSGKKLFDVGRQRKGFYKSTEELDTRSKNLDRIDEEPSRFKFQSVSLSASRRFALSPDKENRGERDKPERVKRKLFGVSKWRKNENPSDSQLPLLSDNSPSCLTPPSVMNTISPVSLTSEESVCYV